MAQAAAEVCSCCLQCVGGICQCLASIVEVGKKAFRAFTKFATCGHGWSGLFVKFLSLINSEEDPDLKDFHLPKAENRTVTDLPSLVIFATVLIGMMVVMNRSIAFGKPEVYYKGMDTWGNVCGFQNTPITGAIFSGQDMSKYDKLLIFDFISKTSVLLEGDVGAISNIQSSTSVCVAECPKITPNFDCLQYLGVKSQYPDFIDDALCKSTGSQGNTSQLKTISFSVRNSRCVPDVIEESIAVEKQNEMMSLYANDWVYNAIADCGTCALELTWITLIAITFTLIFIGVVQSSADNICWFSFSSFIFIGIISTSAMWYMYTDISSQDRLVLYSYSSGRNVMSGSGRNVRAGATSVPQAGYSVIFRDAAIYVTVTAAFFTIICLCIGKKNMHITAVLFKTAIFGMIKVRWIYILPMLTIVAISFAAGLFLYTISLLTAVFKDDYIVEKDQTYQFYRVRVEKDTVYTNWVLLFEFLAVFWLFSFIMSCQSLIACSAIANWYYAKDKTQLYRPMRIGSTRLFRYHLGSAAAGGFLVGFFGWMRAPFSFLQSRLNRALLNPKFHKPTEEVEVPHASKGPEEQETPKTYEAEKSIESANTASSTSDGSTVSSHDSKEEQDSKTDDSSHHIYENAQQATPSQDRHVEISLDRQRTVLEFVSNAFYPCFWTLNTLFVYISDFNFSIVALKGSSFLQAGHDVRRTLENDPKLKSLGATCSYSLFLGKLSVVMIVLPFGGLLLKDKEGVFVYGYPLAMGAFISYLVAHAFLSLFNASVGSVFVCLMEDRALNDGTEENPFFGSEELIRKFRKILEDEDSEDGSTLQFAVKHSEPAGKHDSESGGTDSASSSESLSSAPKSVITKQPKSIKKEQSTDSSKSFARDHSHLFELMPPKGGRQKKAIDNAASNASVRYEDEKPDKQTQRGKNKNARRGKSEESFQAPKKRKNSSLHKDLVPAQNEYSRGLSLEDMRRQKNVNKNREQDEPFPERKNIQSHNRHEQPESSKSHYNEDIMRGKTGNVRKALNSEDDEPFPVQKNSQDSTHRNGIISSEDDYTKDYIRAARSENIGSRRNGSKESIQHRKKSNSSSWHNGMMPKEVKHTRESIRGKRSQNKTVNNNDEEKSLEIRRKMKSSSRQNELVSSENKYARDVPRGGRSKYKNINSNKSRESFQISKIVDDTNRHKELESSESENASDSPRRTEHRPKQNSTDESEESLQVRRKGKNRHRPEELESSESDYARAPDERDRQSVDSESRTRSSTGGMLGEFLNRGLDFAANRHNDNDDQDDDMGGSDPMGGDEDDGNEAMGGGENDGNDAMGGDQMGGDEMEPTEKEQKKEKKEKKEKEHPEKEKEESKNKKKDKEKKSDEKEGKSDKKAKKSDEKEKEDSKKKKKTDKNKKSDEKKKGKKSDKKDKKSDKKEKKSDKKKEKSDLKKKKDKDKKSDKKKKSKKTDKKDKSDNKAKTSNKEENSKKNKDLTKEEGGKKDGKKDSQKKGDKKLNKKGNKKGDKHDDKTKKGSKKADKSSKRKGGKKNKEEKDKTKKKSDSKEKTKNKSKKKNKKDDSSSKKNKDKQKSSKRNKKHDSKKADGAKKKPAKQAKPDKKLTSDKKDVEKPKKAKGKGKQPKTKKAKGPKKTKVKNKKGLKKPKLGKKKGGKKTKLGKKKGLKKPKLGKKKGGKKTKLGKKKGLKKPKLGKKKGLKKPKLGKKKGLKKPKLGKKKGIKKPKLGKMKGLKKPKLGKMKGLKKPKFGKMKGMKKPKLGKMKGFKKPKFGKMKGMKKPKLGKMKGFKKPKFGKMKGMKRPKFGKMKGFKRPKMGKMRGFKRPKMGRMKGMRRPKMGRMKGMRRPARARLKAPGKFPARHGGGGMRRVGGGGGMRRVGGGGGMRGVGGGGGGGVHIMGGGGMGGGGMGGGGMGGGGGGGRMGGGGAGGGGGVHAGGKVKAGKAAKIMKGINMAGTIVDGAEGAANIADGVLRIAGKKEDFNKEVERVAFGTRKRAKAVTVMQNLMGGNANISQAMKEVDEQFDEQELYEEQKKLYEKQQKKKKRNKLQSLLDKRNALRKKKLQERN